MDVELLHLPRTVLGDGVGEASRICRGVNGVLHQARRDLVLVVAVLAVEVVGDDHLGLVAADARHQLLQDVLLAAPELQALLDALHALVLQVDEVGIVPNAHRPQPVEGLLTAGSAAVRHVDHHRGPVLGHGIVGNRAAEEEQLVILMGGDHHQLRLFHRGIPDMHIFRQLTRAEHAQLGDGLIRRVQLQKDVPRLRQQVDAGLNAGKGQALIPRAQQVALRVVLLHLIGAGLEIPADLQRAPRNALRQLYAQTGPVALVRPVGVQIAVGQVALFALLYPEAALPGELRRHLRTAQRGAQQRHRQQQGCKPHPDLFLKQRSQSIFRTAMNASLGTDTVPTWRMRFLPSFCFSSSFFLRVMSPP